MNRTSRNREEIIIQVVAVAQVPIHAPNYFTRFINTRAESGIARVRL
jgi:hypothetical protein